MATASGVLGPKQSKGYFVTLSTLSTHVQYNAPVVSGNGGGFTVAALTTQASALPTGGAAILSGQYLKDMGKTVVSSIHTYRKVQRVLAGAYPSTGAVAAATGAPFYIELPTSSNLSPLDTQVAYLPGLF